MGCYSRTLIACRPYYTTSEAIETSPFTYHFTVVLVFAYRTIAVREIYIIIA